MEGISKWSTPQILDATTLFFQALYVLNFYLGNNKSRVPIL